MGAKEWTLKKVLSLVLCVAMLLSVMVMGTGAVTLTDSEDISPQYREAAEVLTGMGIINGYEDDSFKPQQSITRAEVAAMIYRVATGDVEDEKADINAGAKIFTDVDPDDWYAGYVNYCGDAEYIKGFEDDSFRADENVTGYQVLAMILRAVGYDKNNEFTGTNWTINVASTAAEVGMLKNVDSSVNLSAEAPRELVAEFIFQAVRPVAEDSQTQLVHWSPAAGDYRPDNAWNPESLGEKVFNLDVENDADMWGRPNIEWFNDKTDDVYAAIEIDPVATYTTAVNDCDVYEDTGISGQVETYVNGQDTIYDINKTATKESIGAQGQLVEVYDYTTVDGKDATRIVAIDTFLAQVTDVEAARYDANGHLATEATLTLSVYDAATPTSVELENGSTDWTYAVGDMLLVNAYTNLDTDKVINTGEAEQVGDEAQYVEIVSAAESFVGAQTRIHSSANYHTVNGTDYPDAVKFIRDDAGTTEDYNFNWWQDQYGNLIGVTGITSNYAVLKDMIWIQGTPGYAQATLVYMDGTEATVTVDSIDEFGASDWESLKNGTDTTPSLSDGRTDFGLVSTDSSLNGIYDGYAMYRVDTNSDGSVNLEGTEVYPNAESLHIEYADDVTLNINASAILDVDAGVVKTHVSNSTQFLLKNGDTYTAYTGTANLPDFNWETVEVFYDDEDDDNVADYVYIKSYSDVHGMYVFATSASSYIDVPSRNVVTLEDVYVDGELTEVTTTRTIADEMIRNLGKLYYATWQDNHDAGNYGQLIDVTLVSEFNDNDVQVLFGGIANYLNENIDNNFAYVNGTLIVNDSLSYNVGSTVEVIYTNDDVTYTMNLADVVKAMKDGAHYGLWIVGNRYDNAVTVYAGTELEEENDIRVQGDEGLIVPKSDEITNNTYNVKINDKNADGTLDLTVDMLASSEYAFFTVESSEGTFDGQTAYKDEVTLPDVKAGTTYTVTVYTECDNRDPAADCSAEVWTINVEGWNIISDVVTDIMRGDGSATIGNSPYDVYYSFDAAVSAAKTLNAGDAKNLVFTVDNTEVCDSNNTGWEPKVHVFTGSATRNEAQFDEHAQIVTANTVNIEHVNAGTDLVVMSFVPHGYAGGDAVYFAFYVEK
ncbi:MAG TPA: S-layer homology domain-containing protein [Candidatus Egerieimonas intestinavium]|uniref:S-layer homology domain-containing protein n=1 Tax=Candidatus Egerieimonas intestinavium TaxID=2840777 RepID=A0A9D1JFE6_9FIRM|nr:S-layer homology domain-containing protein [Candidatus Egerieimonas intestinavium]